MKFGLSYIRRSVGVCYYNTVDSLHIHRDNEMKAMFALNEIDYIIYNKYIDCIFTKIIYSCFYLEAPPITLRISVGRINRKFKDITLRVSINYKLIEISNKLSSEVFVELHEIMCLDAIIKGSKKYKIPEKNYEALLERRSKLGQIPEWIPEMESNPQLVIDLYKASVPKPK